jgi:hypothetical protein
MSLRRKNFLDYLNTVDYVRFSHINDDWSEILKECEQCASDHPDYSWTLVTDNFEPWGDHALELKQNLDLNSKYGYTSANTHHWKTTCQQPQIHMSWEKRVIDQLPMSLAVNCPLLQKPGQINPWHRDRYYYFKKNHPEVSDYVIRFLIFLRDWQIGHIVQAGNSVITHWKAGDVILFHPTRFHLSGNIGINNKWTSNATGILNDNIDFEIPWQGFE